MASNLTISVQDNVEPVHVVEIEALAGERSALVDQLIEYRILIGEQKDMIRSVVEFTRFMMADARETLARADQILDRNAGRAGGTALDRPSPSHPRAGGRSYPVGVTGSKSPVYRLAMQFQPSLPSAGLPPGEREHRSVQQPKEQHSRRAATAGGTS